jgi:hypothetical protein
MTSANRLTLYQVVLALAALTGITVLALKGTVSGDVVVAIYSAIIGAGLAGGGALANGVAQARVEEAKASSGGD